MESFEKMMVSSKSIGQALNEVESFIEENGKNGTK